MVKRGAMHMGSVSGRAACHRRNIAAYLPLPKYDVPPAQVHNISLDFWKSHTSFYNALWSAGFRVPYAHVKRISN